MIVGISFRVLVTALVARRVHCWPPCTCAAGAGEHLVHLSRGGVAGRTRLTLNPRRHKRAGVNAWARERWDSFRGLGRRGLS